MIKRDLLLFTICLSCVLIVPDAIKMFPILNNYMVIMSWGAFTVFLANKLEVFFFGERKRRDTWE